MYNTKLIVVLFSSTFIQLVFSGTNCPPRESIRPCFCSVSEDEKIQTSIICAGVNTTQLITVTAALKSMILDRFMLLGAFRHHSELNIQLPPLTMNDIESDESENEVEESGLERLPSKWLSSLRVRALEIQDSALSSCFLCDEPLSGQGEFLHTLIAINSGLQGHLCTTCNTKIAHVTTRELLKTPNLKLLDLSYNNLKVVAGLAFPELKNLKTLVLSHNRIYKVYDKAFDSLPQLSLLDLSNNRLTTINRKMLKDVDTNLKYLDLSWNSIQTIPDNILYNLRGLRELRLSNNLIEVLSENSFARLPTPMEKIDVKGNFVVCNCTMSWVSKKLSKNTKILGKCVAPREVELQELKNNIASLQSC